MVFDPAKSVVTTIKGHCLESTAPSPQSLQAIDGNPTEAEPGGRHGSRTRTGWLYLGNRTQCGDGDVFGFFIGNYFLHIRESPGYRALRPVEGILGQEFGDDIFAPLQVD